MASISTARAAIKTAIGSTIRCYDYNPPSPSFPCAIVGFPTVYDPNDSQDDTASMTIPVTVYVAYSANRPAEDKLESYLATSGAGSLLVAIESAGAQYAIAGVNNFGVLESAQGQPVALGCVVNVSVLA